MSENIRYSILKRYEKSLIKKVEDTHFRNDLVRNLRRILDKSDFGKDTVLNFQCSINTYDEILQEPIDNTAIFNISKKLGYRDTPKRMRNALILNSITTYEDLLRYKEKRLNEVVNKKAKERYRYDFENFLIGKSPRMFGKTSAKVLVELLKEKGILNYYQDSINLKSNS